MPLGPRMAKMRRRPTKSVNLNAGEKRDLDRFGCIFKLERGECWLDWRGRSGRDASDAKVLAVLGLAQTLSGPLVCLAVEVFLFRPRPMYYYFPFNLGDSMHGHYLSELVRHGKLRLRFVSGRTSVFETEHVISTQYRERGGVNVWGISVSDRFELESLVRPTVKPLEKFTEQDHEELAFRNVVANELIAAGRVTKAHRFQTCSRYGRIIQCKGEDRHRFFTLEYCYLRFCSRCGPRSFSRLYAKYAPVLEYARIHQTRKLRLRIITLTSQNTGSLRSKQIRDFNKEVKKALKKLLKGCENWGAIWVNEVGRNNTNLHAHILIFCPYIPQRRLSEVWRQISGNPVVWISQVVASGPKALSYLLKYVSKPPSDDPQFIAQLEIAFHGVRRVHTMGLFYNFASRDPDAKHSHWKQCPLPALVSASHGLALRAK